ncbi:MULTISPECIES: tautomerase family protein [Paenibacillus]|uniref:tautomerase family protein n=1 Tax=Paenibacillus TaxID=44249 RepID=UPI00096C0EE0|nr:MULTISPECIES: tautomerase family protein [Paenibacillus]MCF7756344.1 4-oxalocrotonate tautomerase family protein [Paenibacillus xylanexedens]MDQ0658311.1 4-oxalocrotonate tautomerase [Paenibacillus sp. W2I17]MDQ0722421.1 4-oxalocrotonate tautomerase [Paenibacillus sp. W4I10]MDR6718837.1 4-oxalocrotonate tautomerase [Paenibacillus sp. 2003]OMF63605.1 4-oxalocrotonate tautomerase [Paenibacillus sp. FSL R5-0765]
MPEITIRLYEGRTDEQKQEIVEVFTRELSRIIDREPDYISIEFNEIPWDENVPDNLRSTQSQKQGGEKT